MNLHIYSKQSVFLMVCIGSIVLVGCSQSSSLRVSSIWPRSKSESPQNELKEGGKQSSLFASRKKNERDLPPANAAANRRTAAPGSREVRQAGHVRISSLGAGKTQPAAENRPAPSQQLASKGETGNPTENPFAPRNDDRSARKSADDQQTAAAAKRDLPLWDFSEPANTNQSNRTANRTAAESRSRSNQLRTTASTGRKQADSQTASGRSRERSNPFAESVAASDTEEIPWWEQAGVTQTESQRNASDSRTSGTINHAIGKSVQPNQRRPDSSSSKRAQKTDKAFAPADHADEADIVNTEMIVDSQTVPRRFKRSLHSSIQPMEQARGEVTWAHAQSASAKPAKSDPFVTSAISKSSERSPKPKRTAPSLPSDAWWTNVEDAPAAKEPAKKSSPAMPEWNEAPAWADEPSASVEPAPHPPSEAVVLEELAEPAADESSEAGFPFFWIGLGLAIALLGLWAVRRRTPARAV